MYNPKNFFTLLTQTGNDTQLFYSSVRNVKSAHHFKPHVLLLAGNDKLCQVLEVAHLCSIQAPNLQYTRRVI